MSKFVFGVFEDRYAILCEELGGDVMYYFRDGGLEQVESEGIVYAAHTRHAVVRQNGYVILKPLKKIENGREVNNLRDKDFIIPESTGIGDKIDQRRLQTHNVYKIQKEDRDEEKFERVKILCYDPRILAMRSAGVDIKGCDQQTLSRLGTGGSTYEKRLDILRRLNPSRNAAEKFLRLNQYTYQRPRTNAETSALCRKNPEWCKKTVSVGDITPLLEELERQERQSA